MPTPLVKCSFLLARSGHSASGVCALAHAGWSLHASSNPAGSRGEVTRRFEQALLLARRACLPPRSATPARAAPLLDISIRHFPLAGMGHSPALAIPPRRARCRLPPARSAHRDRRGMHGEESCHALEIRRVQRQDRAHAIRQRRRGQPDVVCALATGRWSPRKEPAIQRLERHDRRGRQGGEKLVERGDGVTGGGRRRTRRDDHLGLARPSVGNRLGPTTAPPGRAAGRAGPARSRRTGSGGWRRGSSPRGRAGRGRAS